MNQICISRLSCCFKIAHVVTTFYPGMAWCRTFELAQDQKRQGWRVEFITGCDGSSDFVRKTEECGFPVVRIPSLRKYVHPSHDMRALVDLVSLFRRRKYDIVHTHLAKAGFVGRWAARLAGTPHILHTVYGPTFPPALRPIKRFIYQFLEKLAGRITDRFIFVGRDLRNLYLRGGVCTPHNSEVIYGGRDLAPFIKAATFSEDSVETGKAALGLSPQTSLIGYVARIVPSKGHMYAIRAFHQAKPRLGAAKLMFVGEARLPSEKAFKYQLLKEIQQLGLEDDVIFAGWVDNPADYYGLFDIFIFPSLYEGLPGAVIEAKAADLPIVAFDCGGVREILGNDFVCAPVGDSTLLGDLLEKAIGRLPKSRRDRGHDLNKIFGLQEVFSTERMVRETQRLYLHILSR